MNDTSTTTEAMTTVFEVLLADTVAVSRHHDLGLGEPIVARVERGESDHGRDGDRGERHGERPEPGGEELHHGRASDALLNPRTNARERERVRLVPQRRSVASQSFEEWIFSHRRLRTSPPDSPSTSPARATGASGSFPR